jgi:hypothetical protein
VSKLKANLKNLDPQGGALFSVRFLLSVLLIVLGVAWITYYYLQVRVDPSVLPAPKAGKPAFMADLSDWNYLIGPGPRCRYRNAGVFPRRSALDLHVLCLQHQPGQNPGDERP